MDPDQVRRVRSFNRTVTLRVGALNDSFLDRGRPLGEARLLYEIGRDGAELRELRARLALDSGYLSRLLRSLERQGLVVAPRRSADDRRVRRATLTRRGLNEVKEYDRRADALAESVLAPLNAAQRVHLVAAVSEVERLLRASAVEIQVEAPSDADSVWCLEQYFRELAERFETGFDPGKSIPTTAAELTPPAGFFMVARLGGQPIGCGGLKVKDRKIGEIKRMWVARSARGLGVGRRMLETLEERAKKLGLKILRLETNRTLKEAQMLYRKSGYREVAPFNDEPYAHHWFKKTLS